MHCIVVQNQKEGSKMSVHHRRKFIIMCAGIIPPTLSTTLVKNESIDVEYITVKEDEDSAITKRGFTVSVINNVDLFAHDAVLIPKNKGKFYDKQNYKGGKKNKRNKKW